MALEGNWTCTVCGHHVTLGRADVDGGDASISTHTGCDDGEGFKLFYQLRRCPNAQCKANDLSVSLYHAPVKENNHGGYTILADHTRPAGIGRFKFLPTTVNPLSATVPKAVVEDYQEAYLIRDLSPKASATLARRALQGMIRDFWDIKKARLHDELKAIEAECDPELYAAMMAIKSVGNIGAHPERDISLIVDIEPGEPQQLLDVLHLLDHEWYVARAARQLRVARMKGIATAKADVRSAAKEALAPVPPEQETDEK